MHTCISVHIYMRIHAPYNHKHIPVCVCVFVCTCTHTPGAAGAAAEAEASPPLEATTLGARWASCGKRSDFIWLHPSSYFIWLHPSVVSFDHWVIYSMSVCVCVRSPSSFILCLCARACVCLLVSFDQWVIYSIHEMNPPFGSHYLLRALCFLL